MASFDSFPSEADRMAQGACDGSGTTRPDYVSSGDFNGMGPDSAQHGSLADGSQSYARTPIQPGWSVQYDATQNPYVVPLATPQQHFYPCEPERTSSFGTVPDARVSPPAFQNHFVGQSAHDASQSPFQSGLTSPPAPVGGQHQHQHQQQRWTPGGHATPV